MAVGGAADLGAGQVVVRDHQEVEVLQVRGRGLLGAQRDLGSGYTAVRVGGQVGFMPTSSLVFR